MTASACGGARGVPSPPPRLLLGCVVVCLLCAGCRAQLQPPLPLEVRNYSYASFERENSPGLVLRKNASINGGALQLTPDSMNLGSVYLANTSGSVLLAHHFNIWRRDKGQTAPAPGSNSTGAGAGRAPPVRVVSFNSTFSINVFYKNDSPRHGEGLAFVVAPSLDGPPPGSEGGYLGLTNPTLEASPAKNRFVAVELDTFKQSYDPNDNHVGLNIGSVVSTKTANLTDVANITIATTSSDKYTVWVQYDGVARHIWVYMANQGMPRPVTPVLDSPLDLSEHVPEKAYIGFTASTGVAYELHCVVDWNLSIEIIPDEKSKLWIVLVSVLVPLAAVVVAVAAYFSTKKLRARRSMERRQELLEHKLSTMPGMPRVFAYKSLRKATNNFDERQRLGTGGYGMVYKGLLPADTAWPEGMEVAVKRFIRDDARGVDDFLAEVDIINRLRHKNIVPLIGWCFKEGQLLLVYEYMPNGSLEQHLFRRGAHEQLPVLSWETRYAMVSDVAAGLHYVHHEYTRMVLHRDIKGSNVLLDASFRARLGDFGLARVIDHDKTSFTDHGVAGTCGFIAPEYSVGHKASRQTDVFAFGALVLEVVTGRYSLLGDPRCALLSDWVWRMHGRDALLGAVDEALGTTDFDHDEARRLLLLGLACSHPNPGDRPAMPEVLQVLSKAAPPPDVPPLKPTFVWPPEGGERFDLSEIELTTTSGSGNGGTVSSLNTYYDSFQPSTAAETSRDYFPALSSGR